MVAVVPRKRKNVADAKRLTILTARFELFDTAALESNWIVIEIEILRDRSTKIPANSKRFEDSSLDSP